MDKAQLTAGARVRLTKKFLRSTGQITGPEPFKRWTVIACPCRSTVAVDEPFADPTYFTDAEKIAHPCLTWRHVNPANLERVK